MTEWSLAAAHDEVSHKTRALDGVERKLAKLEQDVAKTKAAKKQIQGELAEAKRELKAAEKRDTAAAAGAAEGEGNA
jgi:septal ring factor EnvC (AmiA/AmiB activator)